MRSGKLRRVALVAAAAACTLGRGASAEILINVDKDVQRMTVTVDRAQLFVWPVSTGRPGNDTPSGTFHPNRMDADHLSQEWDNAPMPHAVFFDLHGHAIHGFLNPAYIGNPASHGCVRLPTDKAALLFDLIKMEGMRNTTVVITGRTPSPETLLRARRSALREAGAALPASLTLHNREQPPPRRTLPGADVERAKEVAAYRPAPQVYDKLQPPPIAQLLSQAQKAAAYERWRLRTAHVAAADMGPPGYPPRRTAPEADAERAREVAAYQVAPQTYDKLQPAPVARQRPGADGQRPLLSAEQRAAAYERWRLRTARVPAADLDPPGYPPQPHYVRLPPRHPPPYRYAPPRYVVGPQQIYYYLPPVYQQYYVVQPLNRF